MNDFVYACTENRITCENKHITKKLLLNITVLLAGISIIASKILSATENIFDTIKQNVKTVPIKAPSTFIGK